MKRVTWAEFKAQPLRRQLLQMLGYLLGAMLLLGPAIAIGFVMAAVRSGLGIGQEAFDKWILSYPQEPEGRR